MTAGEERRRNAAKPRFLSRRYCCVVRRTTLPIFLYYRY